MLPHSLSGETLQEFQTLCPGFSFLGMNVSGDCSVFRLYGFIYTHMQPEHRMESLTALTPQKI